MPIRRLYHLALLAAATLAVAWISLGKTTKVHGSEVVRNDWYFRESLRAIRDWETILARWEQDKPPQAVPPTFPVPPAAKTSSGLTRFRFGCCRPRIAVSG